MITKFTLELVFQRLQKFIRKDIFLIVNNTNSAYSSNVANTYSTFNSYNYL